MESLKSREKSTTEGTLRVTETKITRKDLIQKNQKNKKIEKMKSYFPRIGCFRTDYDYPTLEKSDTTKYVEMESGVNGDDHRLPTHLVIMVNGIIGSASNWRFAAKQFVKRYPEDLLVHCSKSNSGSLTFDGVDAMGERLADEVISVIKRRPELQKISFVGHSLGGLVARYAIGRLYGQNVERSQDSGNCTGDGSGNPFEEKKSIGKIAGLEPMNFITVATPHLGSRGHKQVPVFFSLHTLEKTAYRISWMLGRTGKHLFLTDGDNGKPPLLLQMVSENGDLQFMSALQSFRRRVAYANTRFDQFDFLMQERAGAVAPYLHFKYHRTVVLLAFLHQSLSRSESVNGIDHPDTLSHVVLLILYPLTSNEYLTLLKDLVGWSTSSIRRHNELPKRQHFSKNENYPHIVNVETANVVSSLQEDPVEAKVNGVGHKPAEMEEAMIRGLTQMSWERVDVSFHKSKQRYFAHSTIQVKSYCIHSDGADVVHHMIDNFLL